MKSIVLTSTMGPGVKLNIAKIADWKPDKKLISCQLLTVRILLPKTADASGVGNSCPPRRMFTPVNITSSSVVWQTGSFVS